LGVLSNNWRSFCVNCDGLVVVRRTCVAIVSRFFSNAASIRFVSNETSLAKPGPGDIRSGLSYKTNIQWYS